MIYLDAAATTPVRREVLEAMWPFLTTEFGNASSQHELGKRAADALRDARVSIAACLNCRASEIVFTSGGTEADNLAIKGIALANPRGRHLVTTAIEHEAVIASCDYLARHHGFEITHVPVDARGVIATDAFRSALRVDTTLCSVMLANNEVGTIEPIAALAELAKAHQIPMHTDAVQAADALDLDVKVLGVDAMSISGHKIGAPKGFGILFVRSRVALEPVLHGGGQERGRRSGTENVAGAVGFARALELASISRTERAQKLRLHRDALIDGVLGAVSAGAANRASHGEVARQCFVLLPGDEWRGRPSAAGRAWRALLKRLSVRRRTGRAVARSAGNGIRSGGRADSSPLHA